MPRILNRTGFCRSMAPILLSLALAPILAACSRQPAKKAGPQGLVIQNPYENVNWASDGRYKGNFHTHTTCSDGNLTPNDVIDRYNSLGYSILALTDHNKVTYPWDRLESFRPSDSSMKKFAEGNMESASPVYENRDAAALKMIAVQGCELSDHHHICSYFNDHNGSATEEESLAALAARNGLAIFNHPGKYKKSVDWYASRFLAFPALIGLEVFNQGNRYPNDRATWDAVLAELMPNRPVWGYSNDDMHTGAKHLGRNWNILLLPELTEDWVRRGLKEGRSYFVYAPAGHNDAPPPAIDAVDVNNAAGMIRIRATACTNIVWISEGRAVHNGDTLFLGETREIGRYVRAELQGFNNSVAGTQPFGLIRPIRTSFELDAAPGHVVYADSAHIQGRVEARNLSESEIAAETTFRLDERILGRRQINLAPGASIMLPVAIPIETINQGKNLEIDTQLGPEYGAFSLVRERHLVARASPAAITAVLPSTRFARITLADVLTNLAVAIRLTTALGGETALQEEVIMQPGETATRNLRLPKNPANEPIALRVVAEFDPALFPVAARLETTLDASADKPVARINKAIKVDGSFNDWGTPPIRALSLASDVFPELLRERWNGMDDLAAAIFLAWDGEALCIGAKVKDDTHVNNKSGGKLWDGDSLQFAIMPEGGEAINAAMALTPNGVQFHQWNGPALDLKPGINGAVVRRETERATYYELRIPLAQLGMPPAEGMRFGFAAVIFDDDIGKGHKCRMQTAPGIAEGWSPASLPRHHLAP